MDRTWQDLLEAGQTALMQGAWEEARASFEAALGVETTPEALEGLGLAAFWLDDAASTIAARERAYRLYRGRDDRVAAARTAICLADDYFTFRGEDAVANGWLRRAERLLDGLPLSPEHGMLAAQAGFYALMGRHDALAAGRHGAEAAACGRTLGIIDLEMHGLALQGLALVSRGEIEEGLSRLDEATAAATSGEMEDPAVIGMTCCYLIFACEWVRDYPRAAQWCERLKEFCERWRFTSLLGICRAHYAGVLIWRGAWEEAEAQLAVATAALTAARPPLAVESAVRLAELRRRQGRWEEASTLLDQAASHPIALAARAALALDQGDAAAAIDWAERFLRRLPPKARTERVAGLEVLLRAHLAAGDRVAAATAADELQTIALATGTEPLRAAALLAEGLCAAADGDHIAARRVLEDAVDLFEHSGAPFEAACARLELAGSLAALGRTDAAVRESRRAAEAFRRMGAGRAADVAEAPVPNNERGPINDESLIDGVDSALPHELTAREIEVLRLLARGQSNQEIAADMVLSVRTVERHISTIYAKLGAHGKVARAMASAYAVRRGLS
jgi:DNA-binding NarL/FixJ family response regulator